MPSKIDPIRLGKAIGRIVRLAQTAKAHPSDPYKHKMVASLMFRHMPMYVPLGHDVASFFEAYANGTMDTIEMSEEIIKRMIPLPAEEIMMLGFTGSDLERTAAAAWLNDTDAEWTRRDSRAYSRHVWNNATLAELYRAIAGSVRRAMCGSLVLQREYLQAA